MKHPRPALAAAAAIAVLVGLVGCSHSTTTSKAEAQPVSTQVFVSTQLADSTSDFVSYIRLQAEQLDGGTSEFAAAYARGDVDLARSLYAPTRMFYNRMLVVSSSFGDLADSLDLEQSDVAPGAPITGWHAIEADLYPSAGQVPLTVDQRAALASALAGNTHTLYDTVLTLRPDPDEQTLGAATLIAGKGVAAANGRIDTLSHSSISDLQGYIDGAKLVFDGIRAVLVTQDAGLATTLDHQFQGVQESLNAQRVGVVFTTYDAVPADDLASLQQKVSELGQSLSRVTPTMGL